VFGLALAVRLVYLWQMQDNPCFTTPLMDAAYHDQWARRIAAGDWLGHEVFFRAPLYPYFLGLIYHVLGTDPLAVRVVQFVIGSLTCGLTCLLGWRLVGPAVGLVAGLGAALYGPLIYFDGELLLPVLETFFAVALLLAVTWAVAPGPPGGTLAGEGRVLPWLLTGLALGLFALTRPNILVFAPVLAGYLIWRLGWRPGGRAVAWIALTVALCLTPVTLRNYAVGGDWVLISSQGGLNLYIGNNPLSDGTSAVIPGTRATWWGGYRDAINIAERAAGHPLKPSAVSRYWTREARQFALTQPDMWLRLTGRKLFLFWYGHELGNNAEEYAATWFSSLLAALMGALGPLRYPFGLLAPLALVGAGLAIRQRYRPLTLPLLLVAVYSASIIAFFVCARFRIPLVPALLVLAAYAVTSGWGHARQRRWGAVAVLAGAALLLGVLLNSDFYSRGRIDYAKAYLDFGQCRLEQNQPREAEAYMRRAMAAAPGREEPRLGLALALNAQGRHAETRQLLQALLRQAPDRWEALVLMGDALTAEGQCAAAEPYYRRALALDPSASEAYVRLAQCLEKMGRPEAAAEVLRQSPSGVAGSELTLLLQARQALARGETEEAIRLGEEALKLAPEHPGLRGLLALAYAQAGDLSAAASHAEAVLAQVPDDAPALTVKARGLLADNRAAEALPLLQRATRADPELAEAWSDLTVALAFTGDLEGALQASQQALRLNPDDSQARFTRAGCLLDLGRREEAAAECRRLLSRDPSFTPARQMLDYLNR
jgi:tetratricopeptide (TPR) repeat protein